MSCQDEAHSQDHDHDHGSHDHGYGDHSHSHEVPLEAGPQDSLYGVIDVVHVTAMNAVGGAEAGQKVIKWVQQRLNTGLRGLRSIWADRLSKTHIARHLVVREGIVLIVFDSGAGTTGTMKLG